MAFKPVKGTEDFYPEEKAVQNAIFDSLRDSARAFGFREVESPAIESMDLLTAKSGEEIKSQLFNFEQKGNEELALRFDLTVPFTRMFVEKQKELPKPVKWFGISRMWRYEAPQKGRFREFYQLSAELFGSDKPEADAEIVNLAIDCLKRFGLFDQDFYVKINNRKLMEGLLLQAGMPKRLLEEITRVIDKKAKISAEAFKEELLKTGLDVATVDKIVEFSDIKGTPEEVFSKLSDLNEESQAGLDELKAVLNLVDSKYVVVDMSLARGLAYYTGTVFELGQRR
jgi:histidyl-tRNA synthetase